MSNRDPVLSLTPEQVHARLEKIAAPLRQMSDAERMTRVAELMEPFREAFHREMLNLVKPINTTNVSDAPPDS
jgi:uncharacterized protein YceH (UPF0502 family)